MFVKCIGHGGASALAPANSLRSFGLAARLGADAVEFDVRLVRGRLLVAHTALDACRRRCLELDEAVRWLAAELDPSVELVVDLKTPGTEEPTLAALEREGLLQRATLTSQCRPILARVRSVDPTARTGISIAGPGSRWLQRWGAWRDVVVEGVRDGHYDAVMVHHRIVDRALVERVHAAGAELHAWTVRAAAEVARLSALGVDGIVATDPRVVLRAR